MQQMYQKVIVQYEAGVSEGNCNHTMCSRWSQKVIYNMQQMYQKVIADFAGDVSEGNCNPTMCSRCIRR